MISKAKNELHATVLKKIGADAVIFPEKEMGIRLAKTLMSADFTEWISLSPDYSLVEIAVPTKWIGRSLQELDIRKKYGINVVGIEIGAEVKINFDPAEKLEKGMVLILVGSNEMLEEIQD